MQLRNQVHSFERRRFLPGRQYTINSQSDQLLERVPGITAHIERAMKSNAGWPRQFDQFAGPRDIDLAGWGKASHDHAVRAERFRHSCHPKGGRRGDSLSAAASIAGIECQRAALCANSTYAPPTIASAFLVFCEKYLLFPLGA